MSNPETIYSVSLLNAQARSLLENELGLIWVRGEISNLTRPQSGHWYFTLKDHNAQVRCAMFRHQNQRITAPIKHGMTILALVRVSLYEPRGDYQLIAERIKLEGEGDLQYAFEQRKKAYSEEGLFDQEHKRPLPSPVRRVGLITSATGAALQDMLTVLKRRDPLIHIVIYPTSVQGNAAAISIAQTIARANVREECDVLIVGRGGGSLEDLWCFNEDIVIRIIAASTIPIISAVGHEVDFTLSDFVADVRAPTPSAAAELISQEGQLRYAHYQRSFLQLQQSMERHLALQLQRHQQLQHRLQQQDPKKQLIWQKTQHAQLIKDLHQSMQHYLEKKNQTQDRQVIALKQNNPLQKIQQENKNLKKSMESLQKIMRSYLKKQHDQLGLSLTQLQMVSPLACLQRGYSVIQHPNGQIVRDVKTVKIGDTLDIQLAQGKLKATITHSSAEEIDRH